jgi:hypothetical protein
MLIIAAFEQCLELEQALTAVEQHGIPRSHILVTPMDTAPNSPYQPLHQYSHMRSREVELGIASATGCSVIGASAGFVLDWGPIYWGLIGAVVGFIVGYWAYRIFSKGQAQRRKRRQLPEVTVIIQCPEDQTSPMKELLWKHQALTVGIAYEPV